MHDSVTRVPLRIACLGDSITAGSHVDAERESYPARLQEMLGERSLVQNFGSGGATLWHGGNPNAFQQLPPLASFSPHLAILGFGINDTRGRDVDYWDHFPEFAGDAVRLIDHILELPAIERILLCLPIANFADLPGMPLERRENVGERLPRLVLVRQKLSEIARDFASRRVTLCDLHSVTENRPEIFAVDGVHLKAAGYNLIAETIRDRILDLRLH